MTQKITVGFSNCGWLKTDATNLSKLPLASAIADGLKQMPLT
jgi:hypothetical protein